MYIDWSVLSPPSFSALFVEYAKSRDHSSGTVPNSIQKIVQIMMTRNSNSFFFFCNTCKCFYDVGMGEFLYCTFISYICLFAIFLIRDSKPEKHLVYKRSNIHF